MMHDVGSRLAALLSLSVDVATNAEQQPARPLFKRNVCSFRRFPTHLLGVLVC